MGNTKGEFTVKLSYQIKRSRRDELEWLQNIWIKGIPFKIAFFLWRLWRKRTATDDNLKRMRIQIVSKCNCYEGRFMETMNHLLLTTPIAQQLWRHFASYAGINIEDSICIKSFLSGGTMKVILR